MVWTPTWETLYADHHRHFRKVMKQLLDKSIHSLTLDDLGEMLSIPAPNLSYLFSLFLQLESA